MRILCLNFLDGDSRLVGQFKGLNYFVQYFSEFVFLVSRISQYFSVFVDTRARLNFIWQLIVKKFCKHWNNKLQPCLPYRCSLKCRFFKGMLKIITWLKIDFLIMT